MTKPLVALVALLVVGAPTSAHADGAAERVRLRLAGFGAAMAGGDQTSSLGFTRMRI